MFKKPKRSYRGNRRNLLDDEGENIQSNETVDTQKPKPVVKVEPKVEFGSKLPRNVLSFHDDIDEDCEVFKVKKSSHSKKVAKRIKEETKKEKEKETHGSDEIKREDTVGHVTVKPNVSAPSASAADDDEFSEERLKRLRAEFLVLTGDDAAAMEDPEEEPTGVASMLKRGIIPDATTIHMAKKQRELAKQRASYASAEAEAEAAAGAGGPSGSGASGDMEGSRSRGGGSNTSRLVREDDDDVSSDEEERVQFNVGRSMSRPTTTVIGTASSARRGLSFGTARNKHEREMQALREQFLAAEQGSGDEDEGAAFANRQWEKQQIEKALPGPANVPDDSSEVLSLMDDHRIDGGGSSITSIPSLTSRVNSSDITVDSLKRALDEHVESVQSVNSGHRQDLERLRSELADSESILMETQASMPRLELESRFFQEMEAYTADFIQCCDEKATKLEYMEKKMLDLCRTYCNRLVERRRHDIQDETLEVAQSMAVAPGSVPSGDAKEEEARRKRSAEREARRMRRRRVRETKKIYHHNEGMSSDDELPSAESMKWNAEREAVETDANSLFDDVLEQYSELAEVLSRYARWRDSYPDSYVEAYVARCIPKLCGPLIRMKLVTWNPLATSCISLERMQWFSSLTTSAPVADLEETTSAGGSEGDDPSTPAPTTISDDIKIIPSVIERIIIPRLRGFISAAWDPLSSSQTSRLVNLLQVLVADYPSISTESKEVRSLLEAAVTRMRESLENDIFIPLYPKSALNNKLSAPSLFLQRQFWSAVKLLGNILAWSNLLSDLLLQTLAIDMLLSRYIIVALVASEPTSDFLLKIVAVHSTFPRDWFEGADTCPACLHNFVRFIERMAVTHFTKDRETIAQIIRILEKMKAAPSATAVMDSLA